jgi:ribosomal protein L18E
MKQPQSRKLCDLSRETLETLANSQRRLLEIRVLSRLPKDHRSEVNLQRVERELKAVPA